MRAGPGLLAFVVVLLVVALVATWRWRERRLRRLDARATPYPDSAPGRREAAVREARRRLDERVLETHLTTAAVAVPRQRSLPG